MWIMIRCEQASAGHDLRSEKMLDFLFDISVTSPTYVQPTLLTLASASKRHTQEIEN